MADPIDGEAAAESAETNPLALSDEDFMKQLETMTAPAATEPVVEAAPVEAAPAEGADTAAAPAASEATDTVAAGAGNDTISGGEGTDSAPAGAAGADTLTGSDGKDTVAGAGAGDKVEGDPPGDKVAEAAAVDHEAFYKKIMTPFQANGKTIELRTPEEAIRLMQQGANYTRKMQEIAPLRKQLTMLKNNNIDEDKLSYLIDLDKRDPEAIKKLIKDSGIDPLEIDTAAQPAYLGGSHKVTDEEVNFGSALEELSSTPEGKETLQDIATRWDQASKDIAWKNPEVMATIHAQRQYGIYGRIADEVDRQKLLGTIPAGTPFLQAYKTIGDQLEAADAFKDLREKHQGSAPTDTPTPPGQVEKQAEPEVVATRVAAPKAKVANGDAASAASPTRSAPQKASEFVNPLAMPDDEFLKQFSGRL